MDAANPLCRWIMLVDALLALIGCQSDVSGSKIRGQSAQEPVAPLPPSLSRPPIVVLETSTPAVPATPAALVAPVTPKPPPPPSAAPVSLAPAAPTSALAAPGSLAPAPSTSAIAAPATPPPPQPLPPMAPTSPAPLAPLPPGPPPAVVTGSPVGPVGPVAPAAPVAPRATVASVPMPPDGPLAPVAPPPSGVVPAIPGPIVSGSPVPSEQKGPAIIKTGYASVPKVANVTELLKTGASRVKVVAVVGASNLVTDQEVVEAMRQRLSEFQGLEGSARITKEKEVYATELRKTIERELILDEMYSKLKKAGKMQVIEEIKDFASSLADRQLREIRKFYGLQSEDEFQMVLRMQGLTMPVIRRQIERQVMADQYIGSLLREKGRRVGLSEIHAYYDAHPNEVQSPDRVKWQQLFVSFTKHPTPQAAYNHAEGIRQKAASGTDFVALVKQYDDGFAGKQNGFGTGEKRN